MLRFLLDEHFSEKVAKQAATRCVGLHVVAMKHWRDGMFLASADSVWLPEAAKDKLTLITYDRATIPPVLKAWAEQGIHHGGVIFVDNRSIPQRDIGGLVKAICKFWQENRKLDWQDRVDFLKPVPR